MAIHQEESLAYINPELAKEWHPTKNEGLTPWDVKPFSNKKVWWVCVTNPEHEWEATVAKRSAGRGCRYCRGKATSKDNSLVAVNPALASEWHPTKNDDLTPEQVRPNSHKDIWWLCKADPRHEWVAKVTDRNSKRNGCPFCSGRKATEDNNLEVVNPTLARQWHPIKNGSDKPSNYKPNAAKKVWWLCDKNSNHEWEARIYSRHREGVGCPYCANLIPCEDNCLATINPELSKEWHPSLNGRKTPRDVVPGSGQKAWWLCKVNPKHFWEAVITDRHTRGYGCPICSRHRPAEDYNLLVCNPELAKQWHPTKNGRLTPDKVIPNSFRRVWWQCERNTNHEWAARVNKRNGRQQGCPFCNPQISRLEVRIFSELFAVFNNLSQQESIEGSRCDILVDEINVIIELDGVFWHKNKVKKDLLKTKQLNNLGFKVIRIREVGLEKLSDNDIVFTPQNEDDEYKLVCMLLDKIQQFEVVSEEQKQKIVDYIGQGYLVNNEMYLSLLKYLSYPLPGQSLEAKFPEIAAEWHYQKNGKLSPADMNYGSGLKVWWLCSINPQHEWQTTINHRTSPNGTGCPYCAGKAVNSDNCLATRNPRVASEWHPVSNEGLTPYDVAANSNKKVWWICSTNTAHVWFTQIEKRNRGRGCPYCWNERRKRGNKDKRIDG